MRVSVKVIPRASRQEVIEQPGAGLKVYLRSAPADGKANDALIKILAHHYKVSRSDIRIVTGKVSRNKMVEIGG